MTSPPSIVPDHRQLTRAVVGVVVVDDDPDVRLLVRHRLRRAGMELLGEACDGAEAVEVVRRTQPDVVLLDLEMPRTPGDKALPHILRVAPSAMVVVFSGADLSEAGRQELLGMGAFAYYEKTDAHRLSEMLAEDLARFRRVLDGEDSVPGWMVDRRGEPADETGAGRWPPRLGPSVQTTIPSDGSVAAS